MAEIHHPWRPRVERCLVSCGASLSLPFSRLPAELNSVSDSSRRHSPTKRIGSINAGWGGVRWVCVGWSEAVGLRKGRLGQDDTRTHFPPSEDYHGVEVRVWVCVCVFAELKETEL